MRYTFPPIPELDYQIVMDALKGYAYPRKSLSDAIKRGELVRVKRGLYVRSGPGIPPYSLEVLANMMYGPSYISLESALAYYGLIPELTRETTCVTIGKTKSFNTPVGKFSYMHLPHRYYGFAYNRKVLNDDRAFLIADPGKALADLVFREKGGFSKRSMREFLFENLRIDSDEFRKLDKGVFNDAVRLTGRRSLAILRMVREDVS